MLTSLELSRFRNFQHAELELSRGCNLLVGRNGQGKTSILEAVFFLSLLRSFRTTNLRHLCQQQAETFQVAGNLLHQNWRRRIEVRYGRERKFLLEDQPVRTAGEFIGQFQVVVFSPDDLQLIQGPATLRRRWLDMLLATSCPHYLTNLQEYANGLRQRNAALRRMPQAAAAFEPSLATSGAALINARQELIHNLEPVIQEKFTRVLDSPSEFKLHLRSQPETAQASTFQEKLAATRQRDQDLGFTGTGPHLDDLIFLLNGHELRHHGSSGQCRLAALFLKLASAQWCRRAANPRQQSTLMLVDDVMAELDQPSREIFCDELQRAEQLLLTCTNISSIPEYWHTARRFTVVAGTIANDS